MNIVRSTLGWREDQDNIVLSFYEAYIQAPKRSRSQLKYQIIFGEADTPLRITDKHGDTVVDLHPLDTAFVTVNYVRQYQDLVEMDKLTRRLNLKN